MSFKFNPLSGLFEIQPENLSVTSLTIKGFTPKSVLFIDANKKVSEDNTNFNWNYSTNTLSVSRLHAGTAPSVDYPLSVNVTPVLDGSSWLAVNFFTTHTATADFSESVTALFAQTTIQTVGYSANGVITGLYGNVRMNTSGYAASIIGMRGGSTNSSTGTVNVAIGFTVATFANVGGGTINNTYGFYTPDQSAGTNNYGFVGQISSGTNKYNLYMSGTAQNYIAGNVGIGQTTPTAYLHLKAGTTAANTAPLKLTSGTFNTTAEAGTMEYNNNFALTESDATRRYIVQAASSTKTTAGAPYTNDGYVTVRINGTDVKLMTTA